MAILKVCRMGNPVLRRIAAEIPPTRVPHPEVQRLIDDLVETMTDEAGIGLAAPQVHQSVRLVVLGDPAPDPEDVAAIPLTVLVNPRWVHRSVEIDEAWEGCLSLPGLRGLVPRSKQVTVAGLDRWGEPVELAAEGYLARVLQHEIDHLDGILYLDRMADLTRLTFLEEYHRYWRPEPEEEADSEDDPDGEEPG
ncbi:MAG: peptide deformylase [Candidatus Latescibacterota bacterium]|jgi:peptide deformylase